MTMDEDLPKVGRDEEEPAESEPAPIKPAPVPGRAPSGGLSWSGSEASVIGGRGGRGGRAGFAREPKAEEHHINPWALVAYFAVLTVAIVLGVYVGHLVATWPMGDIEEQISNYQQNISSRILDGTGENTLRELAEERRVLLSFDNIPDNFISALIVAEDKDFLHHRGVDYFGIARAFWANITSGRVVQGGSTITQQLIKNLFLSHEQTYSRKIKEAILALQLEAKYTKEEILGFYCNTVYFGHQCYGLEMAARYYFGLGAAELDLAQCALLAAIIRAPERYTPYRHFDRAGARRDYVLERMAEFGFIDRAKAAAAEHEPIVLRSRQTEKILGAYFVEEVRKFLVNRFGRQQAYAGGLTAYSTMEPALQRAAERAVRNGLYELSSRQPLRLITENVLEEEGSLEGYAHPDWEAPIVQDQFVHALVVGATAGEVKLRIGESEVGLASKHIPARMATQQQRSNLAGLLKEGDIVPVKAVAVDDEGKVQRVTLTQEPKSEAALVAIEAQTGRILAMVGGFDFNKSQFNCAVQAPRQTGSAFKPLVLCAALEAGSVTLGTTLFDEPTVFDDPQNQQLYEPENYHHEYIGIITVRRVIEKSQNIPAVKMMLYTGIDKVIEVAKRMGVKAELPPYYSLALGSIEMTLLDMTSVLAVLPNQGIRVEPYFIDRVEGPSGEVLFQHSPSTGSSISRTTAFLATQALMGVVLRGTGASAHPLVRKYGIPLAGKTGTTDEYTNAWFIGFSPQIVCGVWVGDRETSTETLGKEETGARAALPIWREFMDAALSDERRRQVRDYEKPPNVVVREVDLRNGLLSSEFTPESDRIIEYFVVGTEPTRYTTFEDDYNLSIDYWRMMDKRVDISFDNSAIVIPREDYGLTRR